MQESAVNPSHPTEGAQRRPPPFPLSTGAERRSRRVRLLTGAFIVLALAACDCGRTQGPVGTHPDLTANPPALSFAACPTLDETGKPVADVFPDTQKFTLDNLGKGTATLTYELRGAGKDQFKITDETKIDALEGSGTAELAVAFTPIAPGDTSAELVIEDGDETTDPIVVNLVGTGSNLPAQPTIKIAYQLPGTDTFTDCIESFNGQIDNCTVNWPDTFIDQTANLKLRVRNEGCPSLKITDLSIEPFGGATASQFFMEQPATPPSAEAPFVLSIADGTQVLDANIRFEPKEDGTGDGQRYSILRVKSNSDKSPESLITLFGYTVAPAIYVTPTFCDFTDASDTCHGTKVPTSGSDKKAIFQVTNGGTTPVLIETVAFRQPTSGRFAIGMSNPLTKIIAPGASEPLEILYTDSPLYVTDIIDITASAMGQPAGTASVRVSGGVLPCLTTNPAQQLDFSTATESPATLPVEICNGTMAGECGTLLLNSVQVTQGITFFKALNAPAAGTQVASGTCASVNIQFTKPVTGGLQTGTLEVVSNDPDYAAPSNYKLNLLSAVPVNQVPVAVLKGPAGQENMFSADLSVLGMNPELLIHGEDSYDPPGTTTPATQFQFFLAKKPTGATADIVDLQNKTMSLDGVKGTQDHILLKLDKNIAGEYKIILIVFDSTGQKSQQVELKILVNP